MILMVLTGMVAFAGPSNSSQETRVGPDVAVAPQVVMTRTPAVMPLAQPTRFDGSNNTLMLLQDHRLEPAKVQPRSRVLLLTGLGAGVVSAGLLGAASSVRSSYLDEEQPTKDQYRANRVLGHAGYGVGVGAGALVLGSVALGEW